MKKYDLLRSGDAIIRVLEVQGDRVLVINCIKRTMPVWVEMVALGLYSKCTSGELSQATGPIPSDVDVSSPVLKCKKMPRKKCSFVAEVKGKR